MKNNYRIIAVFFTSLVVGGCEEGAMDETLTPETETAEHASDEGTVSPIADEGERVVLEGERQIGDRIPEASLSYLACVDICAGENVSCSEQCSLGNKVITCEVYGVECTNYYCGDGICISPESCSTCVSDCGDGAFKTQSVLKLGCKDISCGLLPTPGICPPKTEVKYVWSFPNCLKTTITYIPQTCTYQRTTKTGFCGMVTKETVETFDKTETMPIYDQVATWPWKC